MPIDNDDRRTGKAGYLIMSEYQGLGGDGLNPFTPPPGRPDDFVGQPLDPVFVPIRVWSARISRKSADITSSTCYDPKSDTVWSASLPCASSMEVRAEGVFRLSVLPMTIMAALLDGAAISRVRLGFDDLNPFAEGAFEVSDFIPMNPVDDVVSYSCVLRSHGAVQFAMEPTG